LPARAWRQVTWRNGTNRPWAARFAAVRMTPAHDWRDRRLAPTPRTKYFFVDLPATASVKQLVRLAHQRWAIEQQYVGLHKSMTPSRIARWGGGGTYGVKASDPFQLSFGQMRRSIS